MNKGYRIVVALLVLCVLPVLAQANARLVSVVPLSGGCVSGPTGSGVQAWDIEPGETYLITISNVTECANGGTDMTLNVRIKSSWIGNTDLVATNVAPGVYEFEYTMPLNAVCTLPIYYCTVPGDGSSGLLVTRDDGGPYQAHLRASSFGVGCTNPIELGDYCDATVPTEQSSWGAIKALYN